MKRKKLPHPWLIVLVRIGMNCRWYDCYFNFTGNDGGVSRSSSRYDAYGASIKHLINQDSCSYLINLLKQGGNPKYDSLREWSANVRLGFINIYFNLGYS